MGEDVGEHTATRLDALRGSMSHGGTSWMLVGSLTAAAGAYLFQMLTARAIGAAGYAPLSVLWTVQYLLLSVVLYSVEAWALRLVTRDAGNVSRLLRTLPVLAAEAVGLALLLGVGTFLARATLFQGDGTLALVAASIAVTYTIFVLYRGVLAARARFKAYGVVTALESVARLFIALPLLAVGAGATAVAWAMPLGAAVAASFWLVARRTRTYDAQVDDASEPAGHSRPSGPGRFLLATGPANACGQLLLAGGPLMLVAIGAPSAVVSTFFLTITAARIPLVVAQGGLLSRLLPTLTKWADENRVESFLTLIRRTAVLGVIMAAIAGALSAALGPTVMELLYGKDFRPSPALVAGAVAGVLLAFASMLLNQVIVACHREHLLAAPWLIGLLCAVAPLVTPGMAEDTRVIAGFVLGQAIALVGLALTALRAVHQGASLNER